MNEHPSFLQLDRIALGVEVASATRAHVASCEHCRGHLERVAEHDAPPAWVRNLARSRRRAWLFGGGFVLASAVAVMLFVFVRRGGGGEPEYTTVKSGGPSFTLHIKRGDTVFVWDGVQAVRPGDQLRLEVAATGFRRIRVLAENEVQLYDAPMADGTTLLPTAWKVDSQPGAETLTIVLSEGPPTWRTTLNLEKSTEEDAR
jgi:hypothetical protein